MPSITRKRSTAAHAAAASSSSSSSPAFDYDSEEEPSLSSAAIPKRGRNGKESLRTAPPALPPLAEESDFFDDGADMPRGDITMRELYQLLKTQNTELKTQSAQLSALQRQQNTGRSSSRAFLAEAESSAQHSLSIKTERGGAATLS